MQTVATIVLARLLTPTDFGLVAMVTAITTFGQAFADLGLSEATIQQPEISHNQVSTLFWINLAIGLGLTSITSALAPVLAWFYREPRLIHITLLVSLTFLIGGLRVQHDALLGGRCGSPRSLSAISLLIVSLSRWPFSGLARFMVTGRLSPSFDIELYRRCCSPG